MGYYVDLIGSTYAVPENAEVLQALKDLNNMDASQKGGGSWAGGEQTGAWFSWMPPDYDETVQSVNEVFVMLGFETWEHEGKVYLSGYNDKHGQEELFLAAVAPFVEEGMFTEWRGEDGAMWRLEARGGKLFEMVGETTWSEPVNIIGV